MLGIPETRGLINSSHTFLTGVHLSHGVGWNSVVGRFAMIHLGFKSVLKKQVNDELVGVGVIEEKDLLRDLRALDQKFHTEGA